MPPIVNLHLVYSSNLSTTFAGEFQATVANKSELEVCLYFSPIDKHV